MLKVLIDFDKCNHREGCYEKCFAARVCPTNAVFKLDPGDIATVDVTLCNGCGLCIRECPAGAIFLKEI